MSEQQLQTEVEYKRKCAQHTVRHPWHAIADIILERNDSAL